MAHEVKRLEVMIEKLHDKTFLVREVTTFMNGDKCEYSTSFQTIEDVKKHIDLIHA